MEMEIEVDDESKKSRAWFSSDVNSNYFLELIFKFRVNLIQW